MIKRFCDWCGKNIKDGCGRMFDLPIPDTDEDMAVDICDDCLKKLWDGRLDKPIDKMPLEVF